MQGNAKDTNKINAQLGNPLSPFNLERELRGKNLVALHYYMHLTMNETEMNLAQLHAPHL